MGEQDLYSSIRSEFHKVIIGQDRIIRALIRALYCNGHILIEGVPGLGKTVLIRTLSHIFGCTFKRIQFTADLLPSDIIGINSFDPLKNTYKVIQGPVFTNLLLADEINRASPKVQSALLEAMGEQQVTIGNETKKLPSPFFVFATQNQVESLGTYPLPQAQLDRFFFKLLINYPTQDEEALFVESNLNTRSFESFGLRPLINYEMLKRIQDEVQFVYISNEIKSYAVSLINATRFPEKYGLKLGEFVEYGAGPRASISLIRAAKAEAYINQRDYITPTDIKEVALDTLRHRIQINYLGQSRDIQSDQVIKEILLKCPLP